MRILGVLSTNDGLELDSQPFTTEIECNDLQNPWAFAFELISWADGKGVSLRQDSVGAILNARFVPEEVRDVPETLLAALSEHFKNRNLGETRRVVGNGNGPADGALRPGHHQQAHLGQKHDQ